MDHWKENDRQCTYQRNIGSHSRIHCCRGKAINITYNQCMFVALIIQHAELMRLIILATVACLAVKYFPHYLIKSKIFFKEKVMERKKCFVIFRTNFV